MNTDEHAFFEAAKTDEPQRTQRSQPAGLILLVSSNGLGIRFSQEAMNAGSSSSKTAVWMLSSPRFLGAALALAVLVLYWPATKFEFSGFDDPVYYVHNNQVQAGLSLHGVAWAFTTEATANWHPLTWLSLMVDADLSKGTSTWLPHFTNIAFHALNSVLLFVLLCHATGTKWRSFAVAGLFAFHPLNVECVAWVSERKSVLCMAFLLLSLLAYVRFVKETRSAESAPVGHGSRSGSKKFFAASVALFALSLMSKPMSVTLPFLLLLLDVWPLGRATGGIPNPAVWVRLVREKWPFFLLSAGSCAVTYFVQQSAKAMQTAGHLPMSGRLENALVGYLSYVTKTFWPVNLAVYYPHPGHWSVAAWSLAAVVLILVSIAAIGLWRAAPYFPTGWFWFLGALVPMIGLIQVGTQAMADRYAYLPAIGIFIALVWGGWEIWQRFKLPPAVALFVGGMALAASAAVTHHQLGFWINDGALFGHALAVTKDNPVAEISLAVYDTRNQKIDEAMDHYRAAIKVYPKSKLAHSGLAYLLYRSGQSEAAIEEYRAAIKIDPDFLEPVFDLGLVFESLGRRDEAIAQFRESLRINPGFSPAKEQLKALQAE
jgi:hypothetical protein